MNKQNTPEKYLGSNETFVDFSVLKIEINLGLKHFKWKHISNGKIEILEFKSGKWNILTYFSQCFPPSCPSLPDCFALPVPFFSIKTGLHKAVFPALQNNFGQLQDRFSILGESWAENDPRFIFLSCSTRFKYPLHASGESSQQVGILPATSVKAHRDRYLRSTSEERGDNIQDVRSSWSTWGVCLGWQAEECSYGLCRGVEWSWTWRRL